MTWVGFVIFTLPDELEAWPFPVAEWLPPAVWLPPKAPPAELLAEELALELELAWPPFDLLDEVELEV